MPAPLQADSFIVRNCIFLIIEPVLVFPSDSRLRVLMHVLQQNLMSADKFMAFYLSAGVVASAGSCLIQNIGGLAQRSLGASGKINSLFSSVIKFKFV